METIITPQAPATGAVPPLLVAFDLETTGVDPFTALPVSYGFVQRVPSIPDPVLRVKQGFVNPGVPIPPEVTAIHHITDDMVAAAPDVATATNKIASLISSIWDSGGAIVGMNVSYDLTLVDSLAKRYGLPTFQERSGVGPVLDILVIDRHHDRWRKGSRNLSALCEHYSVTISNAHDAAADAIASLDVLEAMYARIPELSALSSTEINDQLGDWHRAWLTGFSSHLEKTGQPPVSPGRFSWPIQTSN